MIKGYGPSNGMNMNTVDLRNGGKQNYYTISVFWWLLACIRQEISTVSVEATNKNNVSKCRLLAVFLFSNVRTVDA